MTVHSTDPHNLYNDANLRAIDRGIPTFYNGAYWTIRDGWVDYIVDKKDLEPYVGVDLSYKNGFCRKFPQANQKKTEALWNAVKRFAEKTGNGDLVLSENEIAPIHTRAYEIAWSSIYPDVKLKDSFLEFPPELTPEKLDPFDFKHSINSDGFIEGRHGIDIEKLAAKAMEFRLEVNGLPRETEITTVYVRVGRLENISLDNLEEKNKHRADKPGPYTDAITFSLANDNKITPIEGVRWDERDAIWPWPLFQIKETPTAIVADIVRYYYDPKSLWEESAKMVFYVEEQSFGVPTTITVFPKEGVIEQHDASGQTTRLERAKNSWAYDNLLFSHGLPFSLVHYQNQFPIVVKETNFMEDERWAVQDGNSYKIFFHNPAVPTETAELYFRKGDYLFTGYRANGTTVTFGGAVQQDPESGIRYPSTKGSGILTIDKGGSDILTASEILAIRSKGGAL